MIITDIIRGAIYTAGLAPKAIVKGYVAQTTEEKLTWLQSLVTSVLRKVIFAVAGTWLLKLTASGLITQGDVDTLVELAIAAMLAGGAAGWSKILLPLWVNRIWPWVQKQVAPVEPPTPKQA